MRAAPGFFFLAPLIAGAVGLIGGAASAVAAVGGAALSAIGTAGGAVLSTAGTLGGGALSLAGKTVGVAGQAAAGGIGVLGGVPAATTATVDSLGELMPIVIGGIETYHSLTGKEPAGPAEYRASGAAPAPPPPAVQILPIMGAPAGPTILASPVMTTPGQPAAEPNYLLYVGIALAAIVLLRK